MSDCPRCGSHRAGGGWAGSVWQCGTVDQSVPTLTCQNIALRRDLRQANAVIDAVNTLLENEGSCLLLLAEDAQPDILDYGYTISVEDVARGWRGGHLFAGTTRLEALQKAIEARDQHDKERKEP